MSLVATYSHLWERVMQQREGPNVFPSNWGILCWKLTTRIWPLSAIKEQECNGDCVPITPKMRTQFKNVKKQIQNNDLDQWFSISGHIRLQVMSCSLQGFPQVKKLGSRVAVVIKAATAPPAARFPSPAGRWHGPEPKPRVLGMI